MGTKTPSSRLGDPPSEERSSPVAEYECELFVRQALLYLRRRADALETRGPPGVPGALRVAASKVAGQRVTRPSHEVLINLLQDLHDAEQGFRRNGDVAACYELGAVRSEIAQSLSEPRHRRVAQLVDRARARWGSGSLTAPHGPAHARDPKQPAYWVSTAQEAARRIIERDRRNGLFPSQEHISDEIARDFRSREIYGPSGKPLTGAYIKRQALKGIKTGRKQLRRATRPNRGK